MVVDLARLFLRQATSCLHDVAYPMRRIGRHEHEVELDRAQFDEGWARLCDVGYASEVCVDEAWAAFAAVRRNYATVAERLLYWTIAAPGPWSGPRMGFPDLDDRPDMPDRWVLR